MAGVSGGRFGIDLVPARADGGRIVLFRFCAEAPVRSITRCRISQHLEGLEVFRPVDRLIQGQNIGTRRSEEHTSELQSLMRISYAVLCWKKKIKIYLKRHIHRFNNL